MALVTQAEKVTAKYTGLHVVLEDIGETGNLPSGSTSHENDEKREAS